MICLLMGRRWWLHPGYSITTGRMMAGQGHPPRITQCSAPSTSIFAQNQAGTPEESRSGVSRLDPLPLEDNRQNQSLVLIEVRNVFG